ncbi:MAG: DUF5652 family protein [Candidatus Pacearchaeota archaeon]
MFLYKNLVFSQLGLPIEVITLMIIWEGVWTAIAMWKAAKNNHLVWFIVFFIVNLIAIPEIIYILFFCYKNSKKKR